MEKVNFNSVQKKSSLPRALQTVHLDDYGFTIAQRPSQ